MTSKMLSEFLLVARSEDFLVLDTETTGLHDAEIVQIAIVNQDGAVLLDTLVQPINPIPVEATGVHGIDDAMVARAPIWAAVWGEVAELLARRNVIVYNADFDISALFSSTEAAGLDVLDWRSTAEWFCAMRAFAEVYGSRDHYRKSFRWQPLSAALAYYGKAEKQMHTALSDCHHTHFVIQCIAALNLS